MCSVVRKQAETLQFLPLLLILDSLYFIKSTYRSLNFGGIEFYLDYRMKCLKVQF